MMFFSRETARIQKRLDSIKETLLDNLYQDLLYETFPILPSTTSKTRHPYGPFEIKFMNVPRTDPQSYIVRNLKTNTFLGTVSVSPHGMRLINADNIEDLLDALEMAVALDQQARTGVTNPDMTNVTPFRR